MNTPTNPGKLIRNLSLFCLILALGVLNTRADVATLREKGPKSGAAFSNLGLSETSADVKITMRDAQVKILLKKGEGDTLLAECEANFVLENVAPAETGPQDFLVAFPVTGLNSKVVTIDKFAVTVDGKTPPTVFRQPVSVSRSLPKLGDTLIAGQLDARFAPETTLIDPYSKYPIGVSLADKSIYPNAYVWSQNTIPGKTTQVKVTYLVTLHPQPVNYAKSYKASPSDGDVIPFADINVDVEDGPYYFFDYVLRSGATWEGSIGRELITISIDPKLQIHPARIGTSIRRRNGNRPAPPDNIENTPADRATMEALWNSSETEDGNLVYDLKSFKPTRDLLLAIPVKAIGQYQSGKK